MYISWNSEQVEMDTMSQVDFFLEFLFLHILSIISRNLPMLRGSDQRCTNLPTSNKITAVVILDIPKRVAYFKFPTSYRTGRTMVRNGPPTVDSLIRSIHLQENRNSVFVDNAY